MTAARNRRSQRLLPDDRSAPHPPAEPLRGTAPADPEWGEVGGDVRWEMDRLLDLMARYYERCPGASPLGDARSLEWLARELRADADDGAPVEGWSTSESAAVAVRLRARASGARLRLRALDGVPDTRPAAAPGTVADALRPAAAAGCAPRLELSAAAGAGRELWDEECESWVELPHDLPHGPYLALGVTGGSMSPLLHSGDVILVKLGPALASGTMVVARLPDGGYVVKEVGRVGRREVELRSLNPEFPPSRIPRRDDAILGTVILRWCAHAEAVPRRA